MTNGFHAKMVYSMNEKVKSAYSANGKGKK